MSADWPSLMTKTKGRSAYRRISATSSCALRAAKLTTACWAISTSAKLATLTRGGLESVGCTAKK